MSSPVNAPGKTSRDFVQLRRKLGLKRSKSQIIKTEINPRNYKTSTPKMTRLLGDKRRRISITSDCSGISLNTSRTSLMEASIQKVRNSRKSLTNKLKKFRPNVSRTTSPNDHILEVYEGKFTMENFDEKNCSRIKNRKELDAFDDYDFVVWELSPEKKKRNSPITAFFKKLTKI